MKITRFLCTVALLAVVASCTQPQSTMRPGGPAAGNLAQIGWVVYVLFGVASLFMWVLLAWAVTRKKGTLAEHEPWHEGGGQRWVFLGGFVLPFVVFSGVFVFAMQRMSDFPVHSKEHVNPEILVIGHQWWWEVRYLEGGPSEQFTTANEIHIPVGRPIDIQLETRDVIHSFWVPALHGKVDLIPGQPNYIRVEASKPGNMDGQCGEYCGQQHAHMRLFVVAQNEADYQNWRQHQIQPAAEPQSEEALKGREIFNTTACALCHRVRGTVAQGIVAPDLTHLASRKFIAANSYENNQANLEAWITHAQSLKPGAMMPDLTEYDGLQLRALVAYLRDLK